MAMQSSGGDPAPCAAKAASPQARRRYVFAVYSLINKAENAA
jgi:hypothetical protein